MNAFSPQYLGLLLTLVLTAVPQDDKTSVPTEFPRRKLTKELRDLFKDEFGKRDKESRMEFAKKLLANAGNTSDRNQRFVMLAEASEIAAGAGDIDTALDAIGKIVEQYDVHSAEPQWSSTAQKIAALGAARKVIKSREAAAAIASGYLTVARDELKTGDYKTAAQSARDAGSVARSARNSELVNEAKTLAKEVTALQKEFKGIKSAEAKLSTNPVDPDANLTANEETNADYPQERGPYRASVALRRSCATVRTIRLTPRKLFTAFATCLIHRWRLQRMEACVRNRTRRRGY